MTRPPRRSSLDLQVLPQPTDEVCGPTCLHAVYQYFGRSEPLAQIIKDIPPLPDGGTLAVQLGCHALERKMKARLFTNNLQMFDPTWFRPDVSLRDKLVLQAKKKRSAKLQFATREYLRFLDLGGVISLESFTPTLLRTYIDQEVPIMAGLSATYLYDCPREVPSGEYDDILGTPTGHFVLIKGYDQDEDHVLIADPLPDNPPFMSRYYSVEVQRLLTAISLGIVTYDANLLVITPG